MKFLRSEMNPPSPPFENFPKIHPFLCGQPSLTHEIFEDCSKIKGLLRTSVDGGDKLICLLRTVVLVGKTRRWRWWKGTIRETVQGELGGRKSLSFSFFSSYSFSSPFSSSSPPLFPHHSPPSATAQRIMTSGFFFQTISPILTIGLSK